MADEEQGFLRGLINRPVENFRNGMSEWRQHPVQEGLQRLLGLGASAIGGPGAGMAAGQGADRFFNWYNNRGARNVEQFKPTAEGGMRQFSDQLTQGIWNPQGEQPAATPGAQGPSQAGMPGITSPWQSQQPYNSQLGALLGIPNYTQPQGQQQGMPGITSPLPPGMGPSPAGAAGSAPGMGAPSPYMGWAQTGVTPQIGVGGSPNRFNQVGHSDRFSLAPT
jgi:hypothetical protein